MRVAPAGQLGGAAAWPAQVRSLLRRCDFPPAGGTAVCAVSGGADSLAMLALAVASGCRAGAVHVDHALRRAGAEEAEMVRAAAEALGASFQLVKVSVEPGPDLEARARLARYAALPVGVLVGHTADDQAETLLLNLVRGAGLDGLCAMRPAGGGLRGVRRPILRLRRAETASLVRLLGLEAVADPSNFEPRFRRNRIRHDVLPLLAEVSGRDPVPLLSRTAGLLREDADLLAGLAEALDPSDARALRAAPGPLAKRALRSWLRQAEGPEHHPPSAGDVERALAVVAGAVRACEITGGRRLSRHRGRLRLEAPKPVG
ncbi:MAG: tRNA lysidine(34) synthetase TilS [Acidimicrobiales bacterium]